MPRAAELVTHRSQGWCPSRRGLQSNGTDSNAALPGAPSDPPGASMLCYGLEKLGQKGLSRWYFRVFLKNSSPPWKSGWRLPTRAVELPDCSSWYHPRLERRILLSSEEQQCRGGSTGRGQREEFRHRTEECRHCGGAPHGALQSQPQAGILFPMPGDGQTPGKGPGGEHQWSHLCCGPRALVRHSSVLCRASVLPSV